MALSFAPNLAELKLYDLPKNVPNNAGYAVQQPAPNLSRACDQGLVQGILLAGRNPAAPTAAFGDVWGYPNIASGQQVRPLPSIAYTLAVVSDSVLDSGSAGSSSGGQASFATNVMTLTGVPGVGAIALGQLVTSAGVAVPTYILTLASGVINQVGSTYTLSTSPGTIAAQAITTAAAPGAQMVAVAYLDTNYTPHTAVYVLTGQTAVTVAAQIDGGAGGTVANALRQNGCQVVACGTAAANQGNIFICDSTNTYTAGVPQTTTKVFDCILIGDNVDSSSQYTIPAGYYGMLIQLIPAVNDYTTVMKTAKMRVNATTGSDGIFLSFDTGGCSSYNNPVPWDLKLKPVIQEKSDLRIQCIVSAATEISVINQLVIWPRSS